MYCFRVRDRRSDRALIRSKVASLSGYLPSSSTGTMESIVYEPEAKRRKVRKGTRSCWECKGRKIRCTYMTPEDNVCDGYIRRSTNCVSQELPEQPLAPVDRRRQMGNRMVRVEALVERLVKGTGWRPPVSGASVSEANGGSSLNIDVPTPSPAGVAQTPDATSTFRPCVVSCSVLSHV